ncbi:MAG: alanine racemase [Pseudomonadota bacterium]
MARPAKARVFAGALLNNVGVARGHAPNSRLLACVKADGYGHGITSVARIIEDSVDGFAVASIEEAEAIRDSGLKKPVLLLEGPQSADELTLAAERSYIPCINEAHQLQWLESSGRSFPALWFKIDTGMHRLGFEPGQAAEVVRRLQPLAERGNLVACTHFACADEPGDNGCDRQLRRFDDAVGGLPAEQSCANSAAIMSLPASHRHWIRPGYMLYGGSPFANRSAPSLNLLSAMELSAEVISVRNVARGDAVGYGGRWVAQRDSRIATVAIGYGDGYPRHAVDGTPVFVEGERCYLAGRVSMDMITVDVTDQPATRIGSAVTLWGEQLPIDEVAHYADTIGYELLAAMPPRVSRETVT